jgi:NTP pyrophosphatase (non-canonical NTP hydrolase)
MENISILQNGIHTFAIKQEQMSDLLLKQDPTIKDYQEYVNQLEIERGFIDQNALEKCLLLGEEMGELFKAIRKSLKLKTDINAHVSPVKEELADILIYVCSIANRFDIDMEDAFREKEEINKQRKWV